MVSTGVPSELWSADSDCTSTPHPFSRCRPSSLVAVGHRSKGPSIERTASSEPSRNHLKHQLSSTFNFHFFARFVLALSESCNRQTNAPSHPLRSTLVLPQQGKSFSRGCDQTRAHKQNEGDAFLQSKAILQIHYIDIGTDWIQYSCQKKLRLGQYFGEGVKGLCFCPILAPCGEITQKSETLQMLQDQL